MNYLVDYRGDAVRRFDALRQTAARHQRGPARPLIPGGRGGAHSLNVLSARRTIEEDNILAGYGVR
jgi:hypothetical protein